MYCTEGKSGKYGRDVIEIYENKFRFMGICVAIHVSEELMDIVVKDTR